MPRTVIVAHGHPKFRSGGGEIAAYRHFEYMREQGADVFFLGSVRLESDDQYFGPSEHLAKIGERDFLLRTAPMDSYLLNFADIADENRFLDTLLAFDADIFHFHHLWNVGARTVQRLMQARPEAKYALTLHEYLMICANHGQMLKARTLELCPASDPFACAACLPGYRPSSFFLRRLRLLRLLEKFDLIISPSGFLQSRFEAWGIRPGTIKMIENGMPSFEGAEEIEESEKDIRKRTHRFAFFGQCTPTKGLNVLVDAAMELSRRGVDDVHIDVLGVTADQFRLVYPETEIPENLVRFLGPYQSRSVIPKMHRYGWIVVPSIWWENSPLVIQEAKVAQTPVIAANIGGMKEKVSGWGRLFEAGDFYSLADVIEDSSGNLDRYNQSRNTIGSATSIQTYHRIWTHMIEAIEPRPRSSRAHSHLRQREVIAAAAEDQDVRPCADAPPPVAEQQ
jgi:glycosyltransferase involved in cell wall biosynthesis